MRCLHIYTNFCQYCPGYTEINKGTHKMAEISAVSLREAAKILGVSIDTARRAIKAKRLKAFRMHARGHYRVSIRELDQFVKENDYVFPSAF